VTTNLSRGVIRSRKPENRCRKAGRAEAKVSARSPNLRPVGRATQAAACKAVPQCGTGVIPARDSNFPSIGVERYTHDGRPQGPSKPEYRAQYPDARPTFAEASARRVIFPSEPGMSAEASHGRSNGWHRVQCAWDYFRDAKSRCRRGFHRPGCGGSTPPSRRDPFGKSIKGCKLWK
jgi:hypothetical protein